MQDIDDGNAVKGDGIALVTLSLSTRATVPGTKVDLPVAGMIDRGAFWDCTGLITVKFGGQVTSWGDGVFDGVTTSNVVLYLGTHEYDNDNVTDVANKTWRGYDWKEILSYGTP